MQTSVCLWSPERLPISKLSIYSLSPTCIDSVKCLSLRLFLWWGKSTAVSSLASCSLLSVVSPASGWNHLWCGVSLRITKWEKQFITTKAVVFCHAMQMNFINNVNVTVGFFFIIYLMIISYIKQHLYNIYLIYCSLFIYYLLSYARYQYELD